MTACAYKDVSGLFTTEVPEELENSTSGGSGSKKDTTAPVANTEVDDEDELLYGADHVISIGCQMTNLLLNIECLFWFFLQLTLKSDLKEVQFN